MFLKRFNPQLGRVRQVFFFFLTYKENITFTDFIDLVETIKARSLSTWIVGNCQMKLFEQWEEVLSLRHSWWPSKQFLVTLVNWNVAFH